MSSNEIEIVYSPNQPEYWRQRVEDILEAASSEESDPSLCLEDFIEAALTEAYTLGCEDTKSVHDWRGDE